MKMFEVLRRRMKAGHFYSEERVHPKTASRIPSFLSCGRLDGCSRLDVSSFGGLSPSESSDFTFSDWVTSSSFGLASSGSGNSSDTVSEGSNFDGAPDGGSARSTH